MKKKFLQSWKMDSNYPFEIEQEWEWARDDNDISVFWKSNTVSYMRNMTQIPTPSHIRTKPTNYTFSSCTLNSITDGLLNMTSDATSWFETYNSEKYDNELFAKFTQKEKLIEHYRDYNSKYKNRKKKDQLKLYKNIIVKLKKEQEQFIEDYPELLI